MSNFYVISLILNEDILSLKKGDKMDFIPGLNVIVGDQGSGKSTLLNILSGSGRRSYEKSKFTLELKTMKRKKPR
jgi:ABC-type lipoprotein export system ATPase subunit